MPGEFSERQRNRIDELFAAAMDLNAADREEFVDRETAAEPELRPHVRKLLEYSRGASQRIAEESYRTRPNPCRP